MDFEVVEIAVELGYQIERDTEVDNRRRRSFGSAAGFLGRLLFAGLGLAWCLGFGGALRLCHPLVWLPIGFWVLENLLSYYNIFM